MNMKENSKKSFFIGTVLIFTFAVWMILIQCVDVQNVGVNSTKIGFASINTWFHKLTGVHLMIYTITDWLGIVPILICMLFGIAGLMQLLKKKRLLLVDVDILILGVYYIVVIIAYLVFDTFPINYRPLLIDGHMEASYPSSTTLLVLCVMPTLKFQTDRRSKNTMLRYCINVFVALFSAFMVIARLIAGVHWFTDIIGAVLFSMGLFMLYRSSVDFADQKKYKQT